MKVTRAAARIYRERGIGHTSVAEVMQAAGMTVGAFHAQFGTKEALATEACRHAFAEMTVFWERRRLEHGAPATLSQLLANYLSPEHRRHWGEGCPVAALASEVAREAPGSGIRRVFADGIRRFVDSFAELLPATLSRPKRRRRALALYATLAGAILLARATSEDPISDEFLAAATEAAKALTSA